MAGVMELAKKHEGESSVMMKVQELMEVQGV